MVMQHNKKSIVVLPFVNMSNEVENEYFSDGITEEIINALATIPNLKVIARTSAFSFKNQNIDVRKIAEKLGVSTVLEGSIRKAGNRVRITAQFINAEDGTHFWSKNYDRDLDDIFAIQDEISLLIADEIRENFGHFAVYRGGNAVCSPPQARKKLGYFVMERLNFYVGISLYVGINFMSELRYVGIYFMSASALCRPP